MPSLKDDLKPKWREQHGRLHQSRMSYKYRAAMLHSTGDFDIDRDVDFAMQVLRPQVLDLLLQKNQVDVNDILSLHWVDTTDPGVYGCLARKYDSQGRLLEIILKVGCAWAESRGLKTRRTTHENDGLSKMEAEKGSLFHQFRQSIKDDESVEYHWFTLARGTKFRRESPADEWQAAIYYQIEAILSAALGARTESTVREEQLEMDGWPWKHRTSRPWKGADGHCAIEDIWAGRANEPSEEKLQQLAAAKAAYKKVYSTRKKVDPGIVCPYPNCIRHAHSFESDGARKRHIIFHEEGRVVPDIKCFDDRCDYWVKGGDWRLMDSHEQQHLEGDVPCRACGLEHLRLPDATTHSWRYCKVADAEAIHKKKYTLDGYVYCSNDLCHFKKPAQGPSTLKKMKVHEKQHDNGKFQCGKCGLRFGSRPAVAWHKPMCTAPDAVDTDPFWECPEPDCFWVCSPSKPQHIFDAHVEGHRTGEVICPTCGLRFLSDRALNERDHPRRCEMRSRGETRHSRAEARKEEASRGNPLGRPKKKGVFQGKSRMVRNPKRLRDFGNKVEEDEVEEDEVEEDEVDEGFGHVENGMLENCDKVDQHQQHPTQSWRHRMVVDDTDEGEQEDLCAQEVDFCVVVNRSGRKRRRV